MSGESFEWAIKKDVRNNPIVREVDLERHRDMWRSVGFSACLVVAVLLFAAWQQVVLQQYGYRMEQLETLRSPAFVEKRAMHSLHMLEADATVIERVVEAPAPPKSVVAQR
jgi:hypothetical protein